ncbi:hypothetical protein DFH09DRAFT_875746, partial [Mycena vulgaris]
PFDSGSGHPRCLVNFCIWRAFEIRCDAYSLPSLLRRQCERDDTNNVSSRGFLPVIVVDGLDECDDHRTQQQILSLFINAIRAKQLPIRLLICSRPESHLREQINMEQASAICSSLVLSADCLAYEDIRTFLQDKFSTIHSEYQSRGVHLGDPWPSPGALEHLVQKSSGIFIYATTVIRFIRDEY